MSSNCVFVLPDMSVGIHPCVRASDTVLAAFPVDANADADAADAAANTAAPSFS